MQESQQPSDKTLFLIDATSQLFRAYFAIRGLSNDEGLPTSAAYGFTTMLRKLIHDESPPYVAAAFDLRGAAMRRADYAAYKANRPPVPEDLDLQMPWAKKICAALGVPVLELAGFEADDLIATFARRAREAGFDVVVVASDKDLLQLVRPGVVVLNPSKNVRLDEHGVRDSFGVRPDLVRDVLGLMGDSVDNIPGVPGVGEKTAVAVVSAYGGLDRVLERAERFAAAFAARDRLLEAIESHLAEPTADRGLAAALDACAGALDRLVEVEADPELRGREAALVDAIRGGGDAADSRKLKALRQELKALDRASGKRVWLAIHEHAASARMSRNLATLRDDVPCEGALEGLLYRGMEREAALEMFRTLGFRSLLAELESEAGPIAQAPQEPDELPAFTIVRDESELGALAARLAAAGRLSIAVDADAPDAQRARLLGIGLAWEVGAACHVPLQQEQGGPGVSLRALREVLGPRFADPAASKVAHDLIRTSHMLRRHGMPLEGFGLDTRVAAFLLDAGRSSYPLDGAAREFLGRRMPGELELGGTPGVRAASESETVLRLAAELDRRLAARGLRELYDRIDGPLLPVLARMEAHGIRIDTAVLERMGGELEAAAADSRAAIWRLAGGEFNVDSPKQLREVLFERLGLSPGRKTAKSKVASTDAQTLEDLLQVHPIARAILDYRELTKLKSTYVDALPRLVHPETGRVHTSFNPAGAATGRLSSSDPNLQNIPARSALGRRIRSAFVPAPGHRFLASDYSQVELRILAHLAADEELIGAFQAGEDIHRYTAGRIFGVASELVTDTMRQRAKAVNFGIVYGMSETRLAREQGIPRTEARRFIEAYFARFSRVRAYIEAVREQVQQDGFVLTLFGRVRSFPQLRQRIDRAAREQALRAAVNTTIQGTAADLMKLAMLRVDEALQSTLPRARLLLQVHDELLLEAPTEDVPRVREVVREAMERGPELTVPLVVDLKDGESWMDVT
jgi:DNA polymerase-1